MIGWIDRYVAQVAGMALALAVMLVLALPGFFTLPPVDRDEARFAQSSAQMLDSGDFIDIRLGDEVRYKKPVGIYWLQATAAALTGAADQIWSYRLVSLAGSMLAVGFTFALARLILPGSAAFLAAVVLASSILLGAEARLAKTDAMLLATIMAGQVVLARAFLPGGRQQVPALHRREIWGFWIALAAGILIKGPIGPLVTGLTLAGLCLIRRDAAIVRVLRPLPGLGLVALLVLPWLIAITLKSDGAFWAKSIGQDMLAKLGQGQESHGAPPGTYLALVWLTFWPGSVLFVAALAAIWRGRRHPVVQFAAVWVVPFWLIFELTATKLVHYVLPTYPALAVLAVWGVLQAAPRRAFWVAAGLAGVVPLALLSAFFIAAARLGGPVGLPFWAGVAGLCIALPLLLFALRQRAWGATATGLFVASLALSVAIYPSLAQMKVLWLAPRIAAIAGAAPDCTLSVVGYQEPSLLFATRRAALIETAAQAKARLDQPGCVILVIDEAQDFTPAGLAATGPVAGLNLGTGKMMRLQVYERR